MEEQAKNPFLSKTNWMGLLLIVHGVLNGFFGVNLIDRIGADEWDQLILAVSGILVIVFRTIATKKIAVKPAGPVQPLAIWLLLAAALLLACGCPGRWARETVLNPSIAAEWFGQDVDGDGVGDGGVRQYAADPAAAAITAMDAAVTAMEVLQVRAAWPPARQQILRDLDGYPVSDGVKASLTERVRNLDVNIELMREYTNDGGTKNFK